MVNGPFCPACGARARWIAEQHAWGCDRCRQLIPAASKVAGPPVGANPYAPGPHAAPPYTPHASAPAPAPAAAAAPGAPRKSKTGLVIGLSVMAVAAAGGIIAFVVLRDGGSGNGSAGSAEDPASAACAGPIASVLGQEPLRSRHDDATRARLQATAVEHCLADKWSSEVLACLAGAKQSVPKEIEPCIELMPAEARTRFMGAMDAIADAKRDADHAKIKLTGLAPATGAAAGGTEVVIAGEGFKLLASEVEVAFGAATARVVRVDADKIVAVAPAGAAGQTVSVTVSFAPGGERVLDGAFTYAAPPDVFGGIGGAIGSIGGTVVGTAGAGSSGGMGACDRYKAMVVKLMECEALPLEARNSLKESVDVMEQAWAQFANMPPEARKAAEDGCLQGLDALKQAAAALCP